MCFASLRDQPAEGCGHGRRQCGNPLSGWNAQQAALFPRNSGAVGCGEVLPDDIDLFVAGVVSCDPSNELAVVPGELKLGRAGLFGLCLLLSPLLGERRKVFFLGGSNQRGEGLIDTEALLVEVVENVCPFGASHCLARL